MAQYSDPYAEKLIEADRFFRNNEYKEALSIYKRLQERTSKDKKKLTERVATAIKICELKLGTGGSIFKITESTKSYLLDTLKSAFTSSDLKHIGSILTNDSQINASELINRLNICPSQITILLLIAKLANELCIDKELKELTAETNDNCLTIGSVLRSIIDPLYYKSQLTRSSKHSKNNYQFRIKNIESVQEMQKSIVKMHDLADVEMFFRERSKLKYIEVQLFVEKKTHLDKNSQKRNIFAGSIFLNERKFLEKCLFNHYNFVDEWVLVEGACQGYPPYKVNSEGFSKDLSSLILLLFPDPKNILSYIDHGWTSTEGEDAKSELRNRYLRRSRGLVLTVIDIDEFYPEKAFNNAVQKIFDGYDGVVVPQIHFWKKLDKFIIGGYYDISHMRFFKIDKAIAYKQNHNFPETPKGERLDQKKRFKFERKISYDKEIPTWEGTYCYHMGFAKDIDDMKDKTDYYINRGEKTTRPDTTKSRAAWFTEDIPDNCKVLPFSQPIFGVLGK